jgi:hypothetical protein
MTKIIFIRSSDVKDLVLFGGASGVVPSFDLINYRRRVRCSTRDRRSDTTLPQAKN